jgi:secreted Zn-dependent insulinase-like peptidase
LQVNAVDSEFTGVQQDDQCRLMAAMSQMARAGHPLRTFMWGNKRSLWDEPLTAGVAIRERIMAHHAGQYSASRMRLVVISGQALDTLQAWAEELFAPVRTSVRQSRRVQPRA